MSVVAPKLMQESADGQFMIHDLVAGDGADAINNGTDLRRVGCRMGCFQALLHSVKCLILWSHLNTQGMKSLNNPKDLT